MLKTTVSLAAATLLLLSTPLPAATIEQAMAKPGRLESDITRDQRSRPDVVIPLLGLSAGDRVADIFGGAGYYSELLASVVGGKGEVLLHNNQAYLGFVDEGLEKRWSERDPGNITRHDREADKLDLGDSRLDAAMIIMSYHDLFYADPESGWNAIDSDDFLAQIYRSLKPGGRFLIVDHQARSGTGSTDAQTLHRVEQGFAVQDIEAAGFTLSGASSALRNPADDHTLIVFDKSIVGKTDRFILVFRK